MDKSFTKEHLERARQIYKKSQTVVNGYTIRCDDACVEDIAVALAEAERKTAQAPIFGYSNIEVERMILFALTKGFDNFETPKSVVGDDA